MRTTIHNRRGTNHLIDPRFRSELLHSKEVAALVEIQLQAAVDVRPVEARSGDIRATHR